MGACFSVTTSDAFEPSFHSSSSTARVISVDGNLMQYPVPVSVSQVLKSDGFFVCSSDQLNYDTFIPALYADHQLEADQIYFVLPASKLEKRLTATDMASFAVRASLALQNASPPANSSSKGKKDRMTRRRNKNRVSPVTIVKSEASSSKYENEFTIGLSNTLMKKKAMTTPEKAGLGISRSGSVRKLQRYTSKRALKAVRSFRLRLTTIQEGTEVF